MTGTPKRSGDALVEHPADREMNDTLAEAFPGKLVEPLNSSQVLREAWRLEFRISAAQIVAFKYGIRPHASGKQAPAQRAITERRDGVPAAIGQDIGFDAALEQIIRRLQHMKRRDAAKLLHLHDRKIADPDGADFSLEMQLVHHLCRFFDPNQRVGPVNLINVDVVGSKSAQGVIDFLDETGAAGI